MTVSRDVDAPAGRVWDVITDIENSEQVLSSVTDITRIDDGNGFGVGVRWRETRTMFGREETQELEVTAVDPGSSYQVEADAHGAHYYSTMAVEPLGDARSRVRMTFGAEPRTTMAKVMGATVGRLFTGSTRKALEQDLDDIAAAAERRS